SAESKSSRSYPAPPPRSHPSAAVAFSAHWDQTAACHPTSPPPSPTPARETRECTDQNPESESACPAHSPPTARGTALERAHALSHPRHARGSLETSFLTASLPEPPTA